MNTRSLLSATALYGVADLAVVAVGGFLLLPLYTRALTQAEFGHYVAVRANIDVLTYALQLGIPTAVARLYFDYKKAGEEHAYMSSMTWMLVAVLTTFALVCFASGASLWRQLSPDVPAIPAFPYAFGIAALSYVAALAIIWLRSEGRVFAVVTLQLSAAAVLAAVASAAVLRTSMQLNGILLALLVSAFVPAAALPALLGRRFQWHVQWAHVARTLRFALPVLVGYLAYFVLNRFSTLLLQRHVTPEELGVFGLAQQLSMIVAMACTSFGAALQPMVFRSDPSQVNRSLERAGQLLLILMLAVASSLMLFSDELVALVAPPRYANGLPLLMVFAVGNFTLAFTLVSETALLYHHRINTSVGISIASAMASAGLALWLVPEYHLAGGALAVSGGFAIRMLLSQWTAWKLTGVSQFPLATVAMTAICAIGWGALWTQRLPLERFSLFGVKTLALLVLAVLVLLFYRKIKVTSHVRTAENPEATRLG